MKLGGDKGHGSFKLNLQLCNVLHPNSQKNTCLLSMFMAGDSTTNLHTCLDMYREQVSELQGMSLRCVAITTNERSLMLHTLQRSDNKSLSYRGLRISL